MWSTLLAQVSIEAPSLSRIIVTFGKETGDLGWMVATVFASALVVMAYGYLWTVYRMAGRPAAAATAPASPPPPPPVKKVAVAAPPRPSAAPAAHAAPSAPAAPAAPAAAPGAVSAVDPATGKKRSAREMMALRDAEKKAGDQAPAPAPAAAAPAAAEAAPVPAVAPAPKPAAAETDIKVPTRDPVTGKKLSAREVMALREKMLEERAASGE